MFRQRFARVVAITRPNADMRILLRKSGKSRISQEVFLRCEFFAIHVDDRGIAMYKEDPSNSLARNAYSMSMKPTFRKARTYAKPLPANDFANATACGEAWADCIPRRKHPLIPSGSPLLHFSRIAERTCGGGSHTTADPKGRAETSGSAGFWAKSSGHPTHRNAAKGVMRFMLSLRREIYFRAAEWRLQMILRVREQRFYLQTRFRRPFVLSARGICGAHL
jgi:hypothetical protein